MKKFYSGKILLTALACSGALSLCAQEISTARIDFTAAAVNLENSAEMPRQNSGAARPTLDPDNDYNWEDWGDGAIFDGWFTTIWADSQGNRINPAEWIMNVKMQKSTTPEGYIRIIEPWRSSTSWFMSGDESETEPGRDMIIDMTDSRLVIIMPQKTGIIRLHPVSRSPIEYVAHNYEGYALFFKDDVDRTVALNQRFPDQATINDNGVIHVQTPMWSVVRKGEEIDSEDLGGANAPEAIIYLPGSAGLEDLKINADVIDATPEYFNLQGQKVDRPAAGLYIMRRGSHVEKVILK